MLKKISSINTIALPTVCQINNIFKYENIEISSTTNTIPSQINKVIDGILFQKITGLSIKTYFRLISFNKPIKMRLFLDDKIEEYAKHFDKRMVQARLTSNIDNLIKQRLADNECNNLGKTPQQLFTTNTQLKLLSDISNYPWNKGFFIINGNKRLKYGDDIDVHKRWVLTFRDDRHANSHQVSFELYHRAQEIFKLSGGVLSPDSFAISICPVILNGQPLTSLSDQFIETNESMLHSFRGATNQFILQSIPQVNNKIQQLIENDPYLVSKELLNYLNGSKTLVLDTNNVTEEDIKKQDIRYSSVESAANLQPGQYHYDRNHKKYYICLKRSTYGHNVFGITVDNELVIFKIFNKKDKSNGVFLEQIGGLFNWIALQHLGKPIKHAGVVTGGGDTVSWFKDIKTNGIWSFSNKSLIDKSVLQEKRTENKKKEIMLMIE